MASPLLGYNTNVRHHGKLFHIQTEDSGVAHGHIFTHLFADGGRIIATKKSSYAHWLGTERYPGVVKKLMQAQHKAMFIALRDGLFDADEVAGAATFLAQEIRVDDDDDAAAAAAAPPAKKSATSKSAADIDVDALERAAEGYLAKPAYVPTDLSDTTPQGPPASAETRSGSSPGRYQSTQPATRAQRRSPSQRGEKKAPPDSVFGADFLSEKSLDEVIMGYLAEDLENDE